MPAKSVEKPTESPAKPTLRGVTREQLQHAATLRAEGATWNAIREATGTKLGSSAWFRHWEREGIDHIPAGDRVKPKPDAEPAAPAATKPAVKTRARRSTKKTPTA